MIEGYLIRKDLLGWKIAPYVDYDGFIFTLESGEKVGREQGWIAEPENLMAMAQGTKLKTPDQLTVPELEGDELVRFIGKLGYCLDHDWRVRRFMREPFTKLTLMNISVLAIMHAQICGSDEAAQKQLITLGWFDGKAGMVTKKGVLILPSDAPPEGMELGSLCLFRDQMNRHRILLRWRDWFLAAKEQSDTKPLCTLEAMKYIPEDKLTPLDAESVEAFLGRDKFLTPEGLVVGRGSFLTISIDGFLDNPGGGP